MMHDKIQIEVTEQGLAELLDYAMTGMQEIGEFTPVLIDTFRELVNKLPATAWNYEVLKGFTDNLYTLADEDYPLTGKDYEDDDYTF